MFHIRFTLSAIVMMIVVTVTVGALAGQVEKRSAGNSELAVFTPSGKEVHLDQSRMIDQLQSVPHELPIRRVIWQDNGRLSLDIRMTSAIRSKSQLYEELSRWLQFAFHDTDNVQRLQVRIIKEDDRMKKYVLAAIDASRESIEEQVWQELKVEKSELSMQTETSLRLTYTPLWKQLFESRPANEAPKGLSEGL